MTKFLSKFTALFLSSLCVFTMCSCTDKNDNSHQNTDDGNNQEQQPDDNQGQYPQSDKDGYKLTWSDEFDSSEINTDVWELWQRTAYNNEMQFYQPQNACIEDGMLKITAKKEDAGGKHYTSARLESRGKYAFKYGIAEARIKLPSFTGAWPAFWMLGAVDYTSHIGWPRCGEIDILEAINTEQSAYGTCHWFDGTQKSKGDKTTNSTAEWHTYGMVWTEESIAMYVDDHTNPYFVLDITQLPVFQAEFYFIINFAIGGNWPGFVIDDSVFGTEKAEMLVDYVRVYEKI